MEDTPYLEAKRILAKYESVIKSKKEAFLAAIEDVAGKIELLSDLNQTKMCKFEKEIDFYDAVLKSLTKL